MKVNVIVKPKEAVLDPQGSAVRDAMRHLGMPEVRSVRIGKYMEIDVDGEAVDLEKRLHGLCRDLLSNPVIEDYELQKRGVRDQKKTSNPSSPGTGSAVASVQRPTPKAFATRQLNAQLRKGKTRKRK
jgi:phosphoribosylformylglycinamidine synthase